MRINCLSQEHKIETATRTLTQLLDHSCKVMLTFPKGNASLYTKCSSSNVLFPFFSDEEQQDVDTQVLFEFAQELETRYM